MTGPESLQTRRHVPEPGADLAMVLTDPEAPAIHEAEALRSLGCEVALLDSPAAALELLRRSSFGVIVITPWSSRSMGLVSMLERADGSLMDRVIAHVQESRDSLVARLLRRRGLTVLGEDAGTPELIAAVRPVLARTRPLLAPVPTAGSGPDAAARPAPPTPVVLGPLPEPAPAAEPVAEPVASPVLPPVPLLPLEPPPEVGLAVGARVAGRFVVRERLGVGGSADVYRVFDADLRTEVALKLLRPDARVPQAEERLRQELLITRSLAHPNIVRTFDLGSHDGQLFYTMELLEGPNLQDLFEDSVAAARPVVGLAPFAKIARALAAAHRQGVVHRDVKPENIFLGGAHGEIKLTDFGIAKPATQSHASTEVGTVLGTLEYMAPERLLTRAPATSSADLWAMGVMLYLDWTGWLPFTSDNDGELMRSICHVAHRPPRERAPEIPASVEALIERLLDKRVRRRLSDAEALANELDRLAALDAAGRL